MAQIRRCEWAGSDPLYLRYHDTEWGVPIHDDIRIFEFLTLEGAQAGLSWLTVLRKRDSYRNAFDGFDYEKIAEYDGAKVKALLANPGIIRNRLKIRSVIGNARAFMRIRDEFGTFNEYAWGFVGGRTIVNKWKELKQLPARSAESDSMSKDMRKRGFSFVGSTICYSHMQATGMVNDHLTYCFRYAELK